MVGIVDETKFEHKVEYARSALTVLKVSVPVRLFIYPTLELSRPPSASAMALF